MAVVSHLRMCVMREFKEIRRQVFAKRDERSLKKFLQQRASKRKDYLAFLGTYGSQLPDLLLKFK
jgi:hypothetical protein